MSDISSTSNPVVITALFTLSSSPSPEFVTQTFIPRLLSHPRFRSIIHHNSKKRPQFRLDPDFSPKSASISTHHFFVEPLPAPVEFSSQLSNFSSRLSQILSTPLPLSRPLWRIHLFPSWTSQPSTEGATLVIRVHHAISDGIGLVKFFSASLIDTPPDTPSALLTAPERQQQVLQEQGLTARSYTPVEMNSSSKYNLSIAEKSSMMKTVREFCTDAYISSLGVLKPDAPSVFTRDPVHSNKTCALLPQSRFSVLQLKTAARLFGCTINDMLFAALSGACRRYLQIEGDDVDNLSGLRCVIPINRHMLDAYDPSDVANELALVPARLRLDIEDRRQRLEACVKELRRVKKGIRTPLTIMLLKLLARLPDFVRRPFWKRLSRSASLLFTNVPGPVEQVYVGGIPVKSVQFFAPAGGDASLVVGLFSYMGSISISVAGDQNRLRRPEQLIQFLAEEIDELIVMSKEASD